MAYLLRGDNPAPARHRIVSRLEWPGAVGQEEGEPE